MTTGYERYSRHPVWETLRLKRESLNAARFDDANAEQAREDIIEWLDEANKTKAARQPALYLSALDQLSAALNQLPVDTASFNQFVAYRQQSGQAFQQLEQAFRALPPPPPKGLTRAYVELLDQEVDARTNRLSELEQRVSETEKALADRLRELEETSDAVVALRADIQTQRNEIVAVSQGAETEMREA